MLWVEIIGFVATIILVMSFLMKNIFYIRLLNVTSTCIFVVYSILTHTWANLTANIALIIINVTYLIKMNKKCNKENTENNTEKISN